MNRLIGVAALSGLLVLGACGGGGDGPVVSEAQLGLDYSNTAEERHSYTAYETGSYAYTVERGDAATLVYIGGDLEPRENLTHVWTDNGIRYFMGASRDGVGVDRLQDYEKDLTTQDGDDPFGLEGDDFEPFSGRPELYLDPDFALDDNAGIWQALYNSILILNDALPPEFQIEIKGTRATRLGLANEIYVSLETAASITTTCGEGAVACAVNTPYPLTPSYTKAAVLYIPDDFDTSEYVYPRKVIVHELLHALGIVGHVDSIEFPDSIMGTSGEYIPNLGHIISKIDREVLQIMYMNKRSDLYNDWGEWSDTAFHLMGESEDGDVSFGVVLFNGLPQPWARGVKPDTDLADNEDLSGTATWTGSLLGFSGPSPLAGDAELEVDLDTLADDDSEQDLRFRDIYFVNRAESDTTDSSDRWFHTREIDYKVAVAGNWFENVTGDDYERGLVVGSFLGAEHEHMAGTVKRTDMIAAFGGSR